MSDVFISYGNEDVEQARKVASALEANGWSTWWDRKIAAGDAFDQVIEHELEAADCVVVLWSKSSIFSEWVKNEASAAAERGALVPALIDKVKIPLEFRRKQTADLVGWDGNPSHEGFRALCDAVASKTKKPGAAPPQLAPRRGSRQRRWLLGASVAIATGIIAALFALVLNWGKTFPSSSAGDRRSADAASASKAATPAPRPYVVRLATPANNASLPQKRLDNDRVEAVWTFGWHDLPEASRYHLYVIGPRALNPIVDEDTLTAAVYQYRRSYFRGVTRPEGWTWKSEPLSMADGATGPKSDGSMWPHPNRTEERAAWSQGSGFMRFSGRGCRKLAVLTSSFVERGPEFSSIVPIIPGRISLQQVRGHISWSCRRLGAEP